MYDDNLQADEKVKEIERAIQDKSRRLRQVNRIIKTLEEMPETVTEFSPELRATLAENVTVHVKNDVRFTLANGAEVRA